MRDFCPSLGFFQFNGSRSASSSYQNKLEADTDKLTEKIYSHVTALSSFEKFTLVEECASALHELSPRQFQDFAQVLDGLITMDNQIDLFEWSMEKSFSIILI